MSEIQENNMQETLNGTQNQNNDTQVANEEAPVQTETPQNNQDIGDQEQSTFEAAEPPAQEEGPNPADIADPAVTISSEDLVGSDPKVTMNPEDLSGPDADQEPDFDEDVSDFWDAPGNPENSSDSLPGDEIDWSPSELEAMDKPGFVAHEDENAPDIFDEDYDWDKSLSHWDVPPNQYSWDSDRDMEPSSPLGSEEPSTPLKTESEESHNHSEQEAGLGEEGGDVAPGGYDGSGIAGGLGITYDDTDFGEESDERSPDVVGGEEDASEAQSDFTDADYQEVLDDLDNGNLDDVREFLESLGHSDDDTEVAPQDAPGVPDEDGKLVDEGISIEDIVGGEEKVEEGLEDVNNNSTEEYTYDEEAYEDAEDAMKDLQHALKHGDEEERAEALEKLQGYLGGFDKGAEEKDQDGTETQDDQIPSDSANDSDGDPEEVPNTVDKEPVDAPDASGAAVSGPAGGAAGAAVDEAKGLDQDGTETQDNQILSGSDYYDGAFGTMGDTDGDGVLNWEDSDWDTFDRDGDGKEDYLVLDADDDGIVDVKEDADGDGIVDVQDVDADNDGTDDWLVSDFDGNGIEYGKEDDDSDGIENAKDDSDGDGMLDWKDSDSDGNGIDDWVEIFSDPYEFDCFPGEDSYDYNAW